MKSWYQSCPPLGGKPRKSQLEETSQGMGKIRASDSYQEGKSDKQTVETWWLS
jgi:hypothetical protein